MIRLIFGKYTDGACSFLNLFRFSSLENSHFAPCQTNSKVLLPWVALSSVKNATTSYPLTARPSASLLIKYESEAVEQAPIRPMILIITKEENGFEGRMSEAMCNKFFVLTDGNRETPLITDYNGGS